MLKNLVQIFVLCNMLGYGSIANSEDVVNPISSAGVQNSEREGQKSPPDIKYIFSDKLTIPKTLRDQGVYVEFNGSPILTNEIRGYLTKHGYKILDTESGAAAKILFKGYYSAVGANLSTGMVEIQDIVEKGIRANAVEKESETTQTNVTSQQGSLIHVDGGAIYEGAKLTGSLGGGVLVALGANALSEVTGLSAVINNGFNKALGLDKDPYKFCIYGCDELRKKAKLINQIVKIFEIVTIDENKSSQKITSFASYDEIITSQLIAAALTKTLATLD